MMDCCPITSTSREEDENPQLKTFFDRKIFQSQRTKLALEDIYFRKTKILIVDSDAKEV